MKDPAGKVLNGALKTSRLRCNHQQHGHLQCQSPAREAAGKRVYRHRHLGLKAEAAVFRSNPNGGLSGNTFKHLVCRSTQFCQHILRTSMLDNPTFNSNHIAHDITKDSHRLLVWRSTLVQEISSTRLPLMNGSCWNA